MDPVAYALAQFLPAQQVIPEETWTQKASTTAIAGRSNGMGNQGATLLLDGRVLIVGDWQGTGAGVEDSPCWIWDPATNVWTRKANMDQPRGAFAISTRSDGKVLVTGGMVPSGGGPSATSSVYDPATNTWAAGPTLPSGRYSHVQMTLGNGDVLLVGGFASTTPPSYAVSGSSVLSTAGTGTFTAKASLPASAVLQQAMGTTLADGNGLVLGGLDGSGGASKKTYRYNRSANTWTTRADMQETLGRYEGTACVTPDGLVNVIAGRAGDGSELRDITIYDPVANTWKPGVGLAWAIKTWPTMGAVTLLDGRIFFISSDRSNVGDGTNAAWTYRPMRIIDMPGRNSLLGYLAVQE